MNETELANTSPQKKPPQSTAEDSSHESINHLSCPPISPPRESTVRRVESEEHHGSQSLALWVPHVVWFCAVNFSRGDVIFGTGLYNFGVWWNLKDHVASFPTLWGPPFQKFPESWPVSLGLILRKFFCMFSWHLNPWEFPPSIPSRPFIATYDSVFFTLP